VGGAQLIASALACQHATSIDQGLEMLQGNLWELSGELLPSERRILAADAFAQARSLHAKLVGGAFIANLPADVLFASNDDLLTRGSLLVARAVGAI